MDVVERVRAELAGKTGTRWVGIDGYGAAGKTSLAARLQAALPDSVVVHVDDFARPGLWGWERDRFLDQVVRPLRAGRPARYQVWDWPTDSGREWVEIPPGRILLIEGVSSTDTRLGLDWDLTIWVDAPRETRLARARERDGAAMMPVWLDEWIPSEEAYVAAQRPDLRADLVVSGTS